MLFRIQSVEDKSADWKIMTVIEAIEGGKTYTETSVNRNNRDGTVAFPDFDTFKEGATFNGEYWRNPAGKNYIFAPKPKPISRGTGITKAMETKAENIKVAQENKEHSIKVASAMRDSVIIANAIMERADQYNLDTFAETFEVVKEWYLKEWMKTEKQADVPF